MTVSTNNVGLAGTSVSLYFTARITDGTSSLITPNIVILRYKRDCKTSVLSSFTIQNVITQYDISSINTYTIPADTWATTYAQPSFCGDRIVTITDVGTNTTPAAYSSFTFVTILGI